MDNFISTISHLDKIIVKGARVHNLKNIDIEIPRDSFVVFTGISGSGKSSLAFDTIYAEGQRRFMETLSAYARQFIGGIERPDVDKIEGLSPSISIEQKTISHNQSQAIVKNPNLCPARTDGCGCVSAPDIIAAQVLNIYQQQE